MSYRGARHPWAQSTHVAYNAYERPSMAGCEVLLVRQLYLLLACTIICVCVFATTLQLNLYVNVHVYTCSLHTVRVIWKARGLAAHQVGEYKVPHTTHSMSIFRFKHLHVCGLTPRPLRLSHGSYCVCNTLFHAACLQYV